MTLIRIGDIIIIVSLLFVAFGPRRWSATPPLAETDSSLGSVTDVARLARRQWCLSLTLICLTLGFVGAGTIGRFIHHQFHAANVFDLVAPLSSLILFSIVMVRRQRELRALEQRLLMKMANRPQEGVWPPPPSNPA